MQLIKALNSLSFSRSYGRTGASTELFLTENDFKTSFTVNFPKKGEPGMMGIDFITGGWEILGNSLHT